MGRREAGYGDGQTWADTWGFKRVLRQSSKWDPNGKICTQGHASQKIIWRVDHLAAPDLRPATLNGLATKPRLAFPLHEPSPAPQVQAVLPTARSPYSQSMTPANIQKQKKRIIPLAPLIIRWKTQLLQAMEKKCQEITCCTLPWLTIYQ